MIYNFKIHCEKNYCKKNSLAKAHFYHNFGCSVTWASDFANEPHIFLFDEHPFFWSIVFVRQKNRFLIFMLRNKKVCLTVEQ